MPQLPQETTQQAEGFAGQPASEATAAAANQNQISGGAAATGTLAGLLALKAGGVATRAGSLFTGAFDRSLNNKMDEILKRRMDSVLSGSSATTPTAAPSTPAAAPAAPAGPRGGVSPSPRRMLRPSVIQRILRRR